MSGKSKNFLSQLSYTFISQVIITILGIILLKLLSNILTEEGLGAYLVIRRLIALSFPLITLNLAMSLARFISFKKKYSEKYLVFSFFVISSFFILLLITFPFYKNALTKILFGDLKYNSLILPTLLFLYASSFYVICVGFFRGKHEFVYMNIVNIIFWVESLLVFGLVSFINNKNYISFVPQFFIIYAFISFIINIIIINKKEKVINEFKLLRTDFHLIKNIFCSEFFRYGIKRIPTVFFLQGLFFIPVITASTFISLKTAAYIGIIISIVRMIQLLGMPFSILFLPKFSLLKSQKNENIIKSNCQIILDYIFTFPFILGLLVLFFSNELINLWFGSRYEIIVNHLMLVGPFIGIFLGYVLIRSILDGLSEFPYSNIITFSGIFSVIIFSILSIIFSWELYGLTLSLCIGILVMGVLSVVILARKQKLKIFNFKNSVSSTFFLILLVILYSYNKNVHIDSIYFSLFIKLLISFFLIIFSFFLYKKLNYEWAHKLYSELLKRRNKI